MNKFTTSLILIGMPGAGKSTIGLLLAKALAKDFVDTDLLIQLREEKTLQDIVDNHGYLHLRSIEEDVLRQARYPNHIIATGGSAVYSPAAMEHLRHFGQTVFLDVPLPELHNRIRDFETRGLARQPGQSLEELFHERRALYEKYSDITINCYAKTPEQIIDEIIYQEGESFAEKDA